MRHVSVAVIGAGTAGLTALSLLRRETEDFVLINEGWYGTTCAKVGCMPSKVLIQIADDYDRLKKLAIEGIEGLDRVSLNPEKVMQRVQSMRDGFVDKTIAPWQKLPAEKNLNGQAQFIGPNELRVTYQDGRSELLQADKIIIANGSRPVMPAAWQKFGNKVVTSDQFFEQDRLPKRVAVIGLGVIGLELGQAMARLGVNIIGVEMAETIAGLSDPEVLSKAIELVGHDFPIHLGRAAELEETEDGIKVILGKQSFEVDQVLAAMGRRPNMDTLDIEQLGVPLNDRGMPTIDPNTLRIPGTDVYVAGDVTGEKAILHEAADEGRIAAYNVIQGLKQKTDDSYRHRTELGMAFTHPNIGFFGKRRSELDDDSIVIGTYNFNMLGRPRVLQEYEGLIRLFADKTSKKLVGGELVAPRGEHLLHQLAWVHQLEVEVVEILRLPFYHPNLEEGIRHALRDLAKQLYREPVKEVVLS